MRLKHDARTVVVPPRILDRARRALDDLGAVAASRELGISRNALLGMLATGRSMPGTVALVTQRSGDAP